MNITQKNPISSGSEKEALEFILTNCFRSGFGTLSKTEIDLILFTAILKYSDKKNISEYELSKYLQITQQRIRNLKEKASVKYLVISKEDAIKRFVSMAKFGKTRDILYFDIPISDIRVKNELEAILVQENILDYSNLGPKIFSIRIDDFFELIIQFELILSPDKNRESIEEKIIAGIKEIAKDDDKIKEELLADTTSINKLDKSNVKKAFVNGGINFGIDLLASVVPGGAFFSTPVKNLIKSFKGILK